MLLAFARYYVLLDCESLVHVNFTPLLVILVRHLCFPLNAITKYLTWKVEMSLYSTSRVQANSPLNVRRETESSLNCQRERERQRQRQRDRDRERHRHRRRQTQTDRDRDTVRDRENETDRQTDRDGERERE